MAVSWKGVIFLSFANDHTGRLLVKMHWAVPEVPAGSHVALQAVCRPDSCLLVLKYEAPLEDLPYCLPVPQLQFVNGACPSFQQMWQLRRCDHFQAGKGQPVYIS